MKLIAVIPYLAYGMVIFVSGMLSAASMFACSHTARTILSATLLPMVSATKEDEQMGGCDRPCQRHPCFLTSTRSCFPLPVAGYFRPRSDISRNPSLVLSFNLRSQEWCHLPADYTVLPITRYV